MGFRLVADGVIRNDKDFTAAYLRIKIIGFRKYASLISALTSLAGGVRFSPPLYGKIVDIRNPPACFFQVVSGDTPACPYLVDLACRFASVGLIPK